jgi:Leucine-rich repeat (LRR) protein
VSKITDDALSYFQEAPHIERLEMIYSRHFDYEAVNYLGSYFRNLTYLNLNGCPIQTTFEPLVNGCPNLYELDLRGDSWVKQEALTGLAKHKKLEILHLGHVEHADMYCDKLDLTLYLDKILEVSLAIEKKGNLPKLSILWIEECQLFDFLIERLVAHRPSLEIRTHSRSHLIDQDTFKLENTDSSDDDVLF